MTPNIYRYSFVASAPIAQVEETLLLAIIATESLHGESQARLDASHSFDATQRICDIDASTSVGQSLNKLFVGFISREFGRGSFQVERVAVMAEPTTV
jgi:hypothetical protein